MLATVAEANPPTNEERHYERQGATVPGILLAVSAWRPPYSRLRRCRGRVRRRASPVSRSTWVAGRPPRSSTSRIETLVTDAERAALLKILQDEKNSFRANEQLLKDAAEDAEGGLHSHAPGRSRGARYARQSPLEEGGRRIVLGTDRPIGFRKGARPGRDDGLSFTVIEIQLDKNDRGVGKIWPARSCFLDKNKISWLENYGQQPVRFNEIKKVK